jgi:hypothetical protein
MSSFCEEIMSHKQDCCKCAGSWRQGNAAAEFDLRKACDKQPDNIASSPLRAQAPEPNP